MSKHPSIGLILDFDCAGMKITERTRKNLIFSGALGLLLVCFGQGVAFIWANSQTFDEAASIVDILRVVQNVPAN